MVNILYEYEEKERKGIILLQNQIKTRKVKKEEDLNK